MERDHKIKFRNNELVRYGKSLKDLLAHKKDFFDENDRLLTEGRDLNELYSSQPERKKCKNCDYKLGRVDFIKLLVNYTLCERCGHLNGMNEDTNSFCSAVYTDNRGEDYAEDYSSGNTYEYKKRMKDIYFPKATFMRDSLINVGADADTLKYADIGAGSGYFVAAMRDIGLRDSIGYEVSAQQVSHGNTMIGSPLLKEFDINNTIEMVDAINVDVVSMIGVLEHLQHPRKVLSALGRNLTVKYLYISVPLFSMGVFFEMVFPHVMNRQLSGPHTHLYTDSSLLYMEKEFDLERISSWWFGTDMMDLYRSVSVSLTQEQDNTKIESLWQDMFAPVMDSLQIVLDKNRLSSEVHILYRLN